MKTGSMEQEMKVRRHGELLVYMYTERPIVYSLVFPLAAAERSSAGTKVGRDLRARRR
jgi:hypothetical protein